MGWRYVYRPARPSDRFVSPYPNIQAATAAMEAYPPDMFLVKSRKGGADYLYSILMGYGSHLLGLS